jgi:hypothetical protein
MADNILVTPGAGASVATDDIAGHHYQRIKHYYGSEGVAVSPSTGTGVADAGTARTVHASDDPVVARLAAPTTGAQTSVASSTSSVTILAASASRKGAGILNDDANDLRLLLGPGSASATNYTVLLPSGGYYEVPYGYTGVISGIWSADGTGSARVTAFS